MDWNYFLPFIIYILRRIWNPYMELKICNGIYVLFEYEKPQIWIESTGSIHFLELTMYTLVISSTLVWQFWVKFNWGSIIEKPFNKTAFPFPILSSSLKKTCLVFTVKQWSNLTWYLSVSCSSLTFL